MKHPDEQYFGIGFRNFFILLIVYLLAHGGIFLILNSVFWDDWTVYNVNPTMLLNHNAMFGSILRWNAHMNIALLLLGPWIYRVLTFILMFLSGILLWKVLERNDWMSTEDRFLITLLFLVLPLNWARVALVDFPYVLCCFSFYLAWYFIGKNRILALCLFLFSFNTNSLLVFFALPMADWYFRDNKTFDIRKSVTWTLRKLDFVILPFAFWIVKRVYYKPYGSYAGYNEHFSLRNLISSPVNMACDFVHLDVNVFLSICFLIFCMFVIKKKVSDNYKSDGRRMLIAGSAALACALFPYWILGLAPGFFEWESRHQLLMPLGVALLLTCMLKRLTVDSRRLATAILVSISIAISIQTYCELALDWSKQQELISLFSHDDKIRDAGLVIFVDHTDNARNRVYRFYEWNGLMKYESNNERHFGLNPDELNAYMKGSYDKQYFTSLYNANLHVRQPNQGALIVRIEYADESAKAIATRVMRSIKGKANYKIFNNDCDRYCLDKLASGQVVAK